MKISKKYARRMINKLLREDNYFELQYSRYVPHLTNEEMTIIFLDSTFNSLSFKSEFLSRPELVKALIGIDLK